MFLLGRVPLPDDLLQMVLGELDLVGQLLLELLEVAGLEPRLGEEIMMLMITNNDEKGKDNDDAKRFSNLESQPEGPPGPGLADHVASDRPLGHEQTHLVLPQPVADKYK